MKRWFAFVLFSIMALSSVMPLWGIHQAQAQNPKNPPPGESVDMSEIFKDRLNETNNGDFWLGPNSGKISTIDSYKTTAKLSAQLSLDEKYSPAEDTNVPNGDGIFNAGDYLGAWKAIITDEQAQLGIPKDKQYGIFIQLFEVKPGETLGGGGDGDITKIITQGGPYYSTDKLKIPGTNITGVFNREEFRSLTGKMYNVGVFFWALSPKNNFFDKKTVSTNIILTDLKPDTKYYYRLVLSEEESFINGGDDKATTEITEQTSFTTSSTKTDPSPEELQAINGTSNGSSADGNKSALIFGDKVECALSDPTTYFAGCLAMGYYNSIYFVSGWAVRGAAGLMDIFMAYSLGSFIYKNSFIDTGWTVVRDVCNILFIFILLWTAFKMVINDNHFKAQEVIVNIIVIGLLINFSLFFSKVIIDMGNISARVFYNQIRITGSAQNDQDEVAKAIKTGDLQPKAISEALANGLDITAIGETGFKALAKQNNGFIPIGTVWLLLLLGTVINVAAAWIFIKVSFAFLGRILSLWMGMIFSPFAFTSRIIGGGHGGPLDVKRLGWTDWLKGMLEASFYPALYLFFVFLIILLINDKFLASMIDDTTLSPTPYLIVTLFKLLFILGLLKVSASFSEKMSGMFGGELTAMAGKAAAFVGGAAIGIATGGAALGLQRFGGAAKAMNTLNGREGELLKKASTGDRQAMQDLHKLDGKKYGQYKNIDNNTSKEAVEDARKKAQREVESLQKRSTTSWDLRNTKGMQGLSNATGLNFNAGVGMLGMGTDKTTGGLQAQVDRRAVKDAAYFKSIGASEDEIKRAKEGVDETKKALEDAEKKTKNDIADLEEQNKNFVQRAQAGEKLTTLEKAQIATNQTTISSLKKSIDDAHTKAKEKHPAGHPKEGQYVHDESSLTGIELAKRQQIDAEAKLKESSKSGLRRYQEYLNKNHYGHGSDRNATPRWGAMGVRRLIRGDIRGAMTDFRKDISTALTGAVTGALTGGAFAGPLGALIGGIAGAAGNTVRKNMVNLDKQLTNLADHAVAANHIHESHAKSKYKAPGGAWLGKIFDGKGFSSLNTGGGGHDDHGGGHGGGHDDHGGGHH